MAQASNNQLLRAYLAVGGDSLKRQTATTRIKARVEESFADFNLDEIHPSSDLDPGLVVNSLQTLPFGDGPRIVVIYEADKLLKDVSEAIIKYLEDPNPSCVLFMESAKLAKNTRLYKAVAACGKNAIINCEPLKRWNLAPKVIKMAQVHGLTLTADGADELIGRAGEDTVMLDRQLANLADLLGAGARVDAPEVAANVAQTAEVKPWAFLDALSARDVGRAMSLYRLIGVKQAIRLHSLVCGRVRELICAKAMAQRGGSTNDLMRELGKQQFQVRNHMRWASRFDMDELVGILLACEHCDLALKGSEDSDAAFVRLICEFAA